MTLPQSLMGRLTLYYAAAFLVLLGLGFSLVYWSVGAVFDNRMDEELVEDAAELSTLLQQSGIAALEAELEQESSGKEKESLFIFVYDRSASPVFISNLTHWQGLKIDLASVRQLLAGLSQSDSEFSIADDPIFSEIKVAGKDEPVRVISAALSPEYILVLGELLEERAEIMAVLLAAFGIAFLLALPSAGILVWLLTRRAVAGIKKVSDAAHYITAGDLDRRVNAEHQVAEVQLLADTFDAMAERIQTLIHNMREMTDNIAHDLRSPLGRIRILAESSLQQSPGGYSTEELSERTVRECDRLIKMINVSLDVAESEAGVARLNKVLVNSAELIAGVCEMFEPVAEEKEISLAYPEPGADTFTFIADLTSLQRLLANLIDNAIKFTPNNGAITVTSNLNVDKLAICVADTGTGIDESDLNAVFKRFYRSDPSRSRSGCGLGLSYAQAVARAHGGNITVESVKGQFSKFTVVLPLGQPTSSLIVSDAEINCVLAK